MTGSAGECLRGGAGEGSPYARAWAKYISKFLTAYEAHGVTIWGVTAQNEPEFAAPWEACLYDASSEGSFLRNHLGPVLREEHPSVRLLAFDHNKDHAPAWAAELLSDPYAAPFVDGLAYHWYAGGDDRLLDGAQGTPNVRRAAEMLQGGGRILLGTEACHCPSTGYGGGDLEVAWKRAERYVHAVLADLAAGSNGWIE